MVKGVDRRRGENTNKPNRKVERNAAFVAYVSAHPEATIKSLAAVFGISMGRVDTLLRQFHVKTGRQMANAAREYCPACGQSMAKMRSK